MNRNRRRFLFGGHQGPDAPKKYAQNVAEFGKGGLAAAILAAPGVSLLLAGCAKAGTGALPAASPTAPAVPATAAATFTTAPTPTTPPPTDTPVPTASPTATPSPTPQPSPTPEITLGGNRVFILGNDYAHLSRATDKPETLPEEFQEMVTPSPPERWQEKTGLFRGKEQIEWGTLILEKPTEKYIAMGYRFFQMIAPVLVRGYAGTGYVVEMPYWAAPGGSLIMLSPFSEKTIEGWIHVTAYKPRLAWYSGLDENNQGWIDNKEIPPVDSRSTQYPRIRPGAQSAFLKRLKNRAVLAILPPDHKSIKSILEAILDRQDPTALLKTNLFDGSIRPYFFADIYGNPLQPV